MANEKKSKISVRKGVEISQENLAWLYQEFGDDVSLSWYLGLLMDSARELHTIKKLSTPRSIANAAAIEVEEIENEF